MPDFVPRDRAQYELRSDGFPILRLRVDGENTNTLGLPSIRSNKIEVAPLAGWSILPRLTLTVLDGPGDAGFLVAALDSSGQGVDAQSDWVDAVESHGGAGFLLVDSSAASSDLGRGGFARLVE